MGATKIEWAEKVWNPVTGCTKISPGCQHCYAERMSKRLAGRFGYPAGNPFAVTLHPERLDEPLHWRKPSRIFVCSMGDLFHDDVPDRFIDQLFWEMGHTHQRHTFLILTKRPERMRDWLLKAYRENAPYTNVRLGVTAENQEQADKRIPILLEIPATVRFVSIEPMLGPVDLTQIEFDKYTRMNVLEGAGISLRSQAQSIPNAFCNKLDQVICGGETGPGARPMHPDWARQDRDQCQAAGVKFFFKQHGEWVPNDQRWHDHDHLSFTQKHIDLDGVMMCRVGKKTAGRLLDGREWNEIPEVGRDV